MKRLVAVLVIAMAVFLSFEKFSMANSHEGASGPMELPPGFGKPPFDIEGSWLIWSHISCNGEPSVNEISISGIKKILRNGFGGLSFSRYLSNWKIHFSISGFEFWRDVSQKKFLLEAFRYNTTNNGNKYTLPVRQARIHVEDDNELFMVVILDIRKRHVQMGGNEFVYCAFDYKRLH